MYFFLNQYFQDCLFPQSVSNSSFSRNSHIRTNFCIKVSRTDSEHFDTHLMKFPKSFLFCELITVHWTVVEPFYDWGGFVGNLFQIGTYDSSSAFWTHCNISITFIYKFVHFLWNNICFIPNTTSQKAQFLPK